MSAKLPAWQPANNGTGKRMWFLMRDESAPMEDRYYFRNAKGPLRLVRYASCESAKRAAEKLNAAERQDSIPGHMAMRLEQIEARIAAKHPKAARDGELAAMLNALGDCITALRAEQS